MLHSFTASYPSSSVVSSENFAWELISTSKRRQIVLSEEQIQKTNQTNPKGLKCNGTISWIDIVSPRTVSESGNGNRGNEKCLGDTGLVQRTYCIEDTNKSPLGDYGNRNSSSVSIVYNEINICQLTEEHSNTAHDPDYAWRHTSWKRLTITEIISLWDHSLELPSIENVLCVIHKCRREKQMHTSIQTYSKLCYSGLDTYSIVDNYIVPLLVECGNIDIAIQAFCKLPKPDECSCNSLLIGFVKLNNLHEAFNLYCNMKGCYHVQVNIYAFVSLLQACASLKDVQRGQEIHNEVINNGFEKELLVGNTLIGMYAKCGLLLEASYIFGSLPVQDIVSWTAIISAYAEHGPHQEAFSYFEWMETKGISPNEITFFSVVKACRAERALDKGREFHNEIVVKGMQKHPLLAKGLMTMYANCGSFSDACSVFSGLTGRDLATWTTVIAHCADYGYGKEAFQYFEQMLNEGVQPDAVTFSCVLKACSSIRALEKGREIHKHLSRMGFATDPMVGNTLIGMYAKCGSLEEAQAVFNELPLQDCVSWTSLISGYAEHGAPEEAMLCFENMQLQGILPNVVTFACVLKACGGAKALDKGREIQQTVLRFGLEADLSISCSLVTMYASCGELADAHAIFENTSNWDVVLWTALIGGYADNGFCEESTDLFEKMQLEGIFPDAAAYACVLKAFSSIKEIDKGREVHLRLRERGFQKQLLVGNSLVGMYANCGSLKEAQDAFNEMDFHDVMSWTSLISGYAEHGSGKEALHLFEKMLKEGQSVDAVILACVIKACASMGTLQKGREMHVLATEEEFENELSVSNSLINMYGRCGSLVDAEHIFESLPYRDSVTWGSMMKAYCMNHDGMKAVQCFQDMHAHGVKPDTVTFTCLLTACSHSSLVSEGLYYYKHMRDKFNVVPTIEHHTCVIDLLARAGQLYDAEKLLLLLHPPEEATWSALLTACRSFGETELGLRCFKQLLEINPNDATWYALMSDIYVNAGRGDDGLSIDMLRKHASAKKKNATASIELNNELHEFTIGDVLTDEVAKMLQSLNSRILEAGHIPEVDKIVKPITDMEKEGILCEHVEKVAIAFGILSTPQGSTLRLTKNLRMCNNCHDTGKIVSKIEQREIILRDLSCIHHFKEGACTCGDLY